MSPYILVNDDGIPAHARPVNRRQATRESFRSVNSIEKKKAKSGISFTGIEVFYVGVAISQGEDGAYRYAIVLHSGRERIGYFSEDLIIRSRVNSNTSSKKESRARTLSSAKDISDQISQKIAMYLSSYRDEHIAKPVGVGLTQILASLSPKLSVDLWSKLDIVPFIFPPSSQTTMTLDEEAEYMARNTVEQFTVTGDVRITFGHRHEVEVDSNGRAQMTNTESYRETVNEKTTWAAAMKYAESLKRNNTKIAFFNSTPQGGGVALMRHALIRYLRLIGVDCTWYVPYGRPEVFRFTKDNHNILQGVAKDNERLTEERITELDKWALEEAERCKWLEFGGPLSSREKGGADVIIVDDPQMPNLVKLAKERDPTRPVLFRSHIQIRADLADEQGSAASEVWNWIWDRVKECDVFVSHPVRAFVPKVVTQEKVGYLPATTDWKDGLNKRLRDWDSQYYMHEFKAHCFKAGMRQLAYPERDYIVQIARFDPAKGIPDVLKSYALFRQTFPTDTRMENIPQLVIAGHGAVDDPDATRIFDETEGALKGKYQQYREDVIVMRLGPSDQILNALMTCAKVALQLSTREGFEVKVSEALHHGTPIIATQAGGIPLQVQHGMSGYLVAPGDAVAVAKYLHDLFSDGELQVQMSSFAETNVSDEVGTVGNALAWLYLADSLAKGEVVRPGGQWINDMAREKAGLPYLEGETRLPRDV
ncbi:glycosyltransferase family 4 protein [Plenodomus tracheiphilus IPT5]|uniref:Glycosyltransferase family 4 protein n=1 Tax=Plenodomus tracheiphilus IPT5 TaxID=1408161 RepID=A0A6A7BI36_9PLEO|nr:glycosyltransferase family 4 protein [Plenodomus tracheiphilus IPT5]